MAMIFKDSKIPDILMRVLNVCSAYEAVFSSALGGDAEMVRYLLTMGQASVLDVTPRLHPGTRCCMWVLHEQTSDLMLVPGSSWLSEKAMLK